MSDNTAGRCQARRPGRLLEATCKRCPRGMAVTYRSPQAGVALQNPAYRPADAVKNEGFGATRRTPRQFWVRSFHLRLGMTKEIRSSNGYTRVCASVPWRARRRLRDRPRRVRNRAHGARDLALRIAAFDRGAARPHLFDRCANFDAAGFSASH